MFSENGYSLADIAAATGNGNNSNNCCWGDGFGMWIWVILIFAIFGGWGNGFGGFGGYGRGAYGQPTSVYEGYVLNNDFSQLSKQISDAYSMTERKLDCVNNGICDGFYTNAQLINGVNNNILTNANAGQMAMMQGFNGVNAAIKDCCCQTQQNIKDTQYVVSNAGADISRGVERGFADTNYNLANQANMLDRNISDKFCQTNFNAQTNTRNVIDSQNANTQAILAKLDAIEVARKDEKIAELTAMNADLRLRASQEAQNNYLVNQLRPCPVPAYVTCNPFAATNYTNGCCGCNQ